MPATRASKNKITQHFTAKRNTRSAKRLVVSDEPKQPQLKRAKKPFTPTNNKGLPCIPKTPTIPNYYDGNSVDPSLYSPASSRARTISENSDSESLISEQSISSTKENQLKTPKIVKSQSKIEFTPVTPHKTPSTKSASTPLKKSVKRSREEPSEQLPYDFSKSPTSAKEGVEALSPLLKRSKCSPKKVTEKESVRAPEKPTVQVSTPIPSKSSKSETIQQRIARIRAQAAEKSAKKEKLKLKTIQEHQLSTPTADSAINTPKPKSSASSKLAEIKSRLAANKNETAKLKLSNSHASQAIEKVKNAFQAISPRLMISSASRKYIKESYKDINVEDKVRKLGLPVEYKKASKQYKNIELSLAQVHNRKQTAIVGKILRDATQMNKENNLTRETLKICHGIKDDSWKFEWKKGLRSEESTNELETSRIKSENFQLTMKPVNLEEITPKTPKTPKAKTSSSSPIKNALKHVRMEVQHTQERLQDFTRRLLVAVYERHRKFRAEKRNVTEEEEERDYPLDRLQKWDPEFSLNSGVPKLNEFSVDLPLKPGSSGTPGTPCNSRGLLQKMLKTPASNKPEFSDLGTPKGKSTPVSSLLNSPAHKGLPANLLKKYEERRRKNMEKEVEKSQHKESAELSDLRSLYDVARAIKSYYAINKVTSGLIGSIASNITKTSKSLISDKDAEEKIRRLVDLETVKNDKLLEMIKLEGGKQTYIRLGVNVKLQDFKVAVDLAVERKERELKMNN